MRLQEFLASKPLYYKKFDPLRMRKAYEEIKSSLSTPKIIHIIGTNGKGTTGRFLAGALKEAGKRVGHYTSPHILWLRERFWMDGAYVSEEALERAHQKLWGLLPNPHILSYFEYTTFLAMVLFEGCEYVVLEAGLGGEYDATSVFENILTLVTPIDFDHQEFLGETIQEIAATKLRAIQQKALLAPQPHPEVIEVAKKLGVAFEVVSVSKEAKRVVQEAGLAPFFAANLSLAAAGAKRLGVEVELKSIVNYRLPARMQHIGNIVLDVGHNLLSARAIIKALPKKRVLIYNSYKDKAYKEILQTLAPIVERVEIIAIEDERIASKEAIVQAAKSAGLEVRDFKRLEDKKEYLVYGSFKVVEEFVKRCGLDILNT